MTLQYKSKVCVILGAGGHASVIVDCIQVSNAAVLYGLLTPDRSLWGKSLLGVSIVGGDDKLMELVEDGVTHFAIGVGSVGDTRLRKRLFELAFDCGLVPLVVVHPSAICSEVAEIGLGSQLLSGCVISTKAQIGQNVIVNSGAIVEHDCIVEDHVHIATGATLAGGVRVATGAHVGIGAVIRENVTVGENSIVGAGAVVIKSVPPNSVAIGVPARFTNKL